MKTITIAMKMIAFAVGLLAIPDALAQRQSAPLPSVRGALDYDPRTVETIEGKVLSIENTTPANRRGYWIQLMLQTAKETIPVQLGPAWYVDKQVPRIEANDTITVTGSRLALDGRPAIVAADVTRGSELLRLRGDNGVPFWPRKN